MSPDLGISSISIRFFKPGGQTGVTDSNVSNICRKCISEYRVCLYEGDFKIDQDIVFLSHKLCTKIIWRQFPQLLPTGRFSSLFLQRLWSLILSGFVDPDHLYFTFVWDEYHYPYISGEGPGVPVD